MPKSWHDRHAINKLIQDQSTRDLYHSIVADKKPYFFRYIYPNLSKQYNTYIKNTNKNAMREFQMSIAELESVPEHTRTGRQNEFLYYYYSRMPVGMNDCVMNKICRAFESEFDGFMKKASSGSVFDYRFLRCGAEYTDRQYKAIERIYADYNRHLAMFATMANIERVDENSAHAALAILKESFRESCSAVCQNEDTLCNIILDICYSKKATKHFVWGMCGGTIIRNLLGINDRRISFPTLDESGDILYCGKRFRMDTCILDEEEDF